MNNNASSLLTTKVQQAIILLKKENSERSLNSLIRLLEMQGVVQKNQLSRATVHRLLKHHGLSARGPSGMGINTIERRAFDVNFSAKMTL